MSLRKLLNLSNHRILLGKSRCYARLAFLIYLSSLFLLFYASGMAVLKIFLALCLILQLARILKNPRPYPKYQMLSYSNMGWLIHDKFNHQIPFESTRIVIDAGLFFLLELSQASKRRYLVVFFDQLSNDSYRFLNIKEKTS